MGFPNFSLIVEYVCEECDMKEIHFEIIPKLKCPNCDFFYEVVEDDINALPI